MQMIADILLAAGALGAALYCMVLAGRLRRFNNLQNGMGGAVAVLSAQVDDMTRTLQQAQKAAASSSVSLTGLTERAEEVAKRLELMLAAMHDLPESPGQDGQGGKSPARPKEAPASRGEAMPSRQPETLARPAADPSPQRPPAPDGLRPDPKPFPEPPAEPRTQRAPEPEPFSEPTKPQTPGGTEQNAPVFLSHRDHRIEAAG